MLMRYLIFIICVDKEQYKNIEQKAKTFFFLLRGVPV